MKFDWFHFFANFFKLSPIQPDATVEDALTLKQKVGFSGFPVVDKAQKLLGLVTSRDIDFIKNISLPVSDVMTKVEDLVVVKDKQSLTLDDANDILKTKKIGKLPVIDENGKLVALLSRTDLKKNKEWPLASKDSKKQLLVGAAISTREHDRQRVEMLAEAGVDVIVIDSSQGNSIYQIEMIGYIKKNFPKIEVIAGNGK